MYEEMLNLFILSILGHGRLTNPVPRMPLWNDPNVTAHTSPTAVYRLNEPPFTLNGGPATHNGYTYSSSAYRCHDFASERPPPNRLRAGDDVRVQWTLDARHPGDCSLYISYDEVTTPSGEASTWRKLVDFPGCVDETLLSTFDGLDPPRYNTWTFRLPADLPPCDRCVLRWEWIAVQQVVDVEFYVTCADVAITSNSTASFTGDVRIAGIDHLPSDIDEYRRAYDGEFPETILLPIVSSPLSPSSSPPSPYSTPPSPSTCVELWGECESPADCCDDGACYRKSQWYAQCRPDCPTGWQCDATSIDLVMTCVRQCLSS